MILYSHVRSPWCRKVEWSLAEMGLSDSLEVVVAGLTVDEKEGVGAAKARLGVHATVPALVDGAVGITESSAIVFYLADAKNYDAPFLPRAAASRALIHQWDRVCDINLGANILSPWLRNTLFLKPGDAPDPQVFDKARENFTKLEARLADSLARSAHLAGSEFSYADVGMAHLLTQLARVDGPNVTEPKVTRWLEACTGREPYGRLANRSA
jgi:glutathione S-transferase